MVKTRPLFPILGRGLWNNIRKQPLLHEVVSKTVRLIAKITRLADPDMKSPLTMAMPFVEKFADEPMVKKMFEFEPPARPPKPTKTPPAGGREQEPEYGSEQLGDIPE